MVILGAGELGHAIEKLLHTKNVVPVLWDADPAKVQDRKALAEIIPPAECVMLCVPSWSVQKAVESIAPFLSPQATVVSFAKGLDEASSKTMGELLPTILPQAQGVRPAQPFAVVGGPMLAREIVLGKSAAGVIASPDPNVAAALKTIFTSDRFKVETSTDVFSVSLAGVLKNIYAVALGIADGLEFDGNQKGWLAGHAMAEMVAIAKALGADAEIISGTAGFADFLATAYSPYSQNREIGEEIAKNGKCDKKGEGLTSLPPLQRRLEGRIEYPKKLPLMELIHNVGIACQPAKPLIEEFLNSSFNSS